jgi:DNA-binding CsgD family transcriptional regulator
MRLQTGFGQRLLEREVQLRTLHDLVLVASGGDGAIALVEGPAGIGKSRLVDAGLTLSRQAGMTPLAARGSELERGIAFGIVRQLFEGRIARLGDVARRDVLSGAATLASPVVSGTAERDELIASEPSNAVVHGLYWLTANLASIAPLALVVDDAHWADPPSLRYLANLATRVADLPALLILARRPAEPGAEVDLLDTIAASPRARPVRPRALGLEAVGELVGEALAPDPDARFVAACHQVTGGNPLFLREVLASLAETGCLPVAEESERVHALAPGSVTRSVLRRLTRLGADAVALARAAAVLDADADLVTVATLAGLDREAASAAAAGLVRIEVLTQGSFGFVHPIVRSAVLSDLPSVEVARLHGRAGHLLAEAGRADEEVAAQLLAAEPRGDAWAYELLRRAAHDARASGAPEVAATYLARALDEEPPADVRAELLRELGNAEAAAAKPDAVKHLKEAVAATREPLVRASVALELARALTVHGDLAAAAEVLQRSLAECPTTGGAIVDRLDAELIAIAISDLGLRHRAELSVARLFEEGSSIRDPLRLATLAAVLVSVMEPASVGADLAERASSAPGLDPERDQLFFLHAGNALAMANRYARAQAIWDQGAELARRRGSVFAFGFASALRAGLAAERLGDLVGAEADLRMVLDLVDEDPRLRQMVVAAPLVLVLIERGELAEAEALDVDGGLGIEVPERIDQNFVLESTARLRFEQGRTEEGIALLRELGRRLEAFGVRNPAAVSWRSMLAAGLAATGQAEQAREFVAEELELARAFDVPREIGVALRAQGLLEDGDQRVETLRGAVAVLEATRARLDHARALVDLGDALVQAGYRMDARDPLRGGLDLARRCGATVLARRAHTLLLASGARPRRLVFSGIESLTAGERRTAGMAADGMTNREIAQALFVTEKTVEGHLVRAFRKLGIVARSELPRAFGRG